MSHGAPGVTARRAFHCSKLYSTFLKHDSLSHTHTPRSHAAPAPHANTNTHTLGSLTLKRVQISKQERAKSRTESRVGVTELGDRCPARGCSRITFPSFIQQDGEERGGGGPMGDDVMDASTTTGRHFHSACFTVQELQD